MLREEVGPFLQTFFLLFDGTKERFVSVINVHVTLSPVVQKVDKAVHRTNHYPLDSAIGFAMSYPLGIDLSGGFRYPGACFSKVPKPYGPFSGVTIPFVSQERTGFKSSNFTVSQLL